MERKYGVLSNYEPTYMDKMRWWMQDALTPYMGGDAKRAGTFVQDKVMPTAEFLPGVGDAMAAAEARDEFAKGNYGMGGLLAAGAAVGLVPGVGDAAQKGIMRILDTETGKIYVRQFDNIYQSLINNNPERYQLIDDVTEAALKKTEVEKRGDEVLSLLKSGRAEEITDEMLDMGDSVKNANLNAYLTENYDLPMDLESRQMRAADMGFDESGFHGTNEDFTGFDSRSVYMSNNPTVAQTYSMPPVNQTIMPIEMRAMHGRHEINANGENWNRISKDSFYDDSNGAPQWAHQMAQDVHGGPLYDLPDINRFSTREIEKAVKQEGFSGAKIKDLIDNGPGSVAMLARPGASNVTMSFYPNQVRSRFARFDPRLKHLRNLSAGLAPFAAYGLLNQYQDENYQPPVL